MKKLLLTLNTIALTTAPMVTVVACGSGSTDSPTTPDGDNGSGGEETDSQGFTDVTDQTILYGLEGNHDQDGKDEQYSISRYHLQHGSGFQETGIFLPDDPIYEVESRNNNDPANVRGEMRGTDHFELKDGTNTVGGFVGNSSIYDESHLDMNGVEKDGEYFYEYRHGDEDYHSVNGEEITLGMPFENESTGEHLKINTGISPGDQGDTKLFRNMVIGNRSTLDGVISLTNNPSAVLRNAEHLYEDGGYRIPAKII